MNNSFPDDEKLYRAVLPPDYAKMFWKENGSLSSAAFSDPKGLSVERGDFRGDEVVIAGMKKFFRGCIVSVTAKQCRNVDAVIKYLPTKRSNYHSEIHGSESKKLLSKPQRRALALNAKKEYME